MVIRVEYSICHLVLRRPWTIFNRKLAAQRKGAPAQKTNAFQDHLLCIGSVSALLWPRLLTSNPVPVQAVPDSSYSTQDIGPKSHIDTRISNQFRCFSFSRSCLCRHMPPWFTIIGGCSLENTNLPLESSYMSWVEILVSMWDFGPISCVE